MLGGVDIPHDRGLAGHSDADVLLHAICNALLGAAGLDDLGSHYPGGDPRYKDLPGRVFLEKVAGHLTRRGYRVVNIDAVVVAERPRLSPYKDAMRKVIAEALGLETGDVNVKASSTEGLGFIGKEEGMAAQAVCMIRKADARRGRRP